MHTILKYEISEDKKYRLTIESLRINFLLIELDQIKSSLFNGMDESR